MIAPIVSLGELRAGKVSANDLRRLQDIGTQQGLMWLPLACVSEPPDTADEFKAQSAALLYRQSLLTQTALDQCERTHRLSECAQRLLIKALIQVVSPNNFTFDDPDLKPPDMSDGWAP